MTPISNHYFDERKGWELCLEYIEEAITGFLIEDQEINNLYDWCVDKLREDYKYLDDTEIRIFNMFIKMIKDGEKIIK